MPLHVVVGYDFSVACAAAFTEAARFAAVAGGRLSVVHVVEPALLQKLDPLTASGNVAGEEGLKEALRIECGNALQALCDNDDALSQPEISYHVRKGNAQTSLISFCEEADGDVLIIGQHGSTWLKRLVVGNRAANLLHSCALPLMTVTPGAEINDILVGVDFSSISGRLVRAAASMASLYGARLHILHVGGSLIDKLSAGDEFQERAREQLSALMASLQAELDATGISYDTHLRFGSPIDEILDCAHDVGCDLLVLGSVGRDGFRKWLQGNTAENIAQKLDCSLLTFRPA